MFPFTGVVRYLLLLPAIFFGALSQKSHTPNIMMIDGGDTVFDGVGYGGIDLNDTSTCFPSSSHLGSCNKISPGYSKRAEWYLPFEYQSEVSAKTSITEALTNQTVISDFLRSILPVIASIVSLPATQLHPNPTTNALFTALVNMICMDNFQETEIFKILSHPDILRQQKDLMQQCSSAEYCLEASFAREIKSGAKTVEEFIYYDNYVSLVQFEMDSLKQYAENVSINRAVVIGSGPLPLTAVEILKHLPPSAVITNYDHSDEANELATIVVDKMERVFVEHRTALEISAEDLHQVDLVYLAALVGFDKTEKKKIIDHIYDVMRPGSILFARSAIGLKTLVYRRLAIEEFGKFSNIQEFHPKDKRVINSIMCGTR